MSECRVLLIDGDIERAESLRSVLEFIDYRAVVVHAADEIDLHAVRTADWMAIIVGKAEGDSITAFVNWLRRDRMHPPLLVLQPYYESVQAKCKLDSSACLMLETPVRYSQLNELLNRAGRLNPEQVVRAPALSGPTGQSGAVRRLRKMIEQVASFDTTVLVTGESGTGKEVVARAIHEQSSRRDRPFVAVNCGAIPHELLESELFGHEKGAFTGAITARRGRFEMADGGTLFLDEIGDMPLPMQVKILRVLQERSYERVGSNRSSHCDVRIITATHRNLEEAITKGTFREDLFYRLNVFPIEMPPLRERLEDLPMLVDDLTRALERGGRGKVRLAPDAINALRRYHWPGNVRELSNLIERLAVLHPQQAVGAAELPERYRVAVPGKATDDSMMYEATQMISSAGSVVAPISAASVDAEVNVAAQLVESKIAALPADGVNLKDHIEGIELSLIRQAMLQAGGVVAHAAKLLCTRRTTLVEKLRKYGLTREDVDEPQSAYN
ncbi:MAG: sigma-54 dependent transcriptional regulator [Pseudomonadota bacterium]|nr:sigma-54 dependent transcriptional regulator [Pseudomonadota bacterium]